MDNLYDNVEDKEKFSVVISEISSKISSETVTLEDFLDIIGENGLFMSCMILTAPFLLPVSIPGTAIIFGSAIFLLSSDIIFTRPILIPKRFMKYKISKKNLELILNEISNVLGPLENNVVSPRFYFLTKGRLMEKINGIAVAFGSILLITPIIAPLGDFLPSYGILFVCLGNLEQDGYLVLAGYVTIIVTAIYYALIFAVGIGIIIFIISYFGHHL